MYRFFLMPRKPCLAPIRQKAYEKTAWFVHLSDAKKPSPAQGMRTERSFSGHNPFIIYRRLQ